MDWLICRFPRNPPLSTPIFFLPLTTQYILDYHNPSTELLRFLSRILFSHFLAAAMTYRPESLPTTR